MDSEYQRVQHVLGLIGSSKLEYPLDELLASFVRDAALPSQAAAYIEDICRPGPDFEQELLDAARDRLRIVEACKFLDHPRNKI